MNIVLYDGLCSLCNFSIRFIIASDKREGFRFASLQSAVGKTLLKLSYVPHEHLDSIVYLKADRVFLRSAAVLNILRDIGGIWSLCYALMVLPGFIRDFAYNLIANSRYRVFGRLDSCPIPPECIKHLFLD